MNATELKAYIAQTYAADAEYPWAQYPNYAVFRHGGNQKWFALLMELPQAHLGLQEDGVIQIVNLKCDLILTGSLREKPGFFPAYHMNKQHWITVSLDGQVSDDELKILLDMSFELTAVKAKKRKTATEEADSHI